jgi:membrane protein DedA with SNARE-associated domain
VTQVERWFQKSGPWMIFLSRMLPYVRPFACFPAGITRMNFPIFLLSALCGSIIWCSVLLGIGWSLGKRWMFAVHLIQRYTLPTFFVLALLILLYLLIMRVIRSRLQSQIVLEHVDTEVATGALNTTEVHITHRV